MDGDADHSVWRQIASMLWNYVMFRTVNEARHLAGAVPRRSAALNGPVARFIDQGFVAMQTLSIRKLMERAATKEDKQVISLRRVLDDLRDSRELITREVYVAHDGLPYDPEPARSRHIDAVLKQGGVWVGGLPTEGPDAFDISTMVHECFDRLSGVSPDGRSRGDLIRPEVFAKLEQAVAESGWKDIATIGNKYIAHAADATSRAVLDGRRGYSFDDLDRCHEALCRTANAISSQILWEGSHGLLATAQYDVFDQIDERWVESHDIARLAELWDEQSERMEAWRNTDFLYT